MPLFASESLARWSGGRWTAVPASPLTGFDQDSRRIRPGQVFVALATACRDGHDFLAAAAAAGAGAALVAHADGGSALPQLVVADPLTAWQTIAREHRRSFSGPVIGVTGSAGKTSTKNLLALLLGAANATPSDVLATEGNFNNHLGVPLTLTRLDPAVHRYAVIEAGISAPGEMATLAAMIEPDLALVTLIAPAHLRELGGLEGVAREKARLAEAVRPGGAAFYAAACAAFAPFRRLPVPSLAVDCVIRRSPTGTEITLPGNLPHSFHLPPVSEGMARNAALAVRAALHLRIAPDDIRQRLAAWRPAPLRGEIRQDGDRLLYVDCYNANPASMADALDCFVELSAAAPARFYLLGGMEDLGPEAPRYHRDLGARLSLRSQDQVAVWGEHAECVRTGALAAGARAEQFLIEPPAPAVAERLAMFSGAVFVKGSRKYQLENFLTRLNAGPALRC